MVYRVEGLSEIKAKFLLQELWRKKLEWYQDVTGRELELWEAWKNDFRYFPAFTYPRCFEDHAPEQVDSLQLHVFADASEIGFAAVAYLRFAYISGRISCRFLMTKSRMAPLRPLTIPKLELQASVMAVRLSATLLKELDLAVHKVSYWRPRSSTSTIKHDDFTPSLPIGLVGYNGGY